MFFQCFNGIQLLKSSLYPSHFTKQVSFVISCYNLFNSETSCSAFNSLRLVKTALYHLIVEIFYFVSDRIRILDSINCKYFLSTIWCVTFVKYFSLIFAYSDLIIIFNFGLDDNCSVSPYRLKYTKPSFFFFAPTGVILIELCLVL